MLSSLVTVLLLLSVATASDAANFDDYRLGCFVDKPVRDLSVSLHSRGRTTRKFCLEHCRALGYEYAGLQASDWCNCGNTFGRYGPADDSQCKSKCLGNRKETCGGGWRNEIFSTRIRAAEGIRKGCYIDSKKSSRDLPVTLHSGSRTSKKFCLKFCKSRGFRYAGLQAGDWCHCGNSFGRYGKASDSECNKKCRGNTSRTCGGNWRNEIFTTGVWRRHRRRHHKGCYIDRSERDLSLSFHAGARTTQTFCLNYCKSRGYRFAGLQASDWCNCGNRYGRYGRVSISQCHDPCKGDASQTCGGGWRNEILATGLTSEGIRIGCFVDKGKDRDLPVIVHSSNKTKREYCVKYCRKRGYRYASTQAGDWCHCGNSFGRHGRVKDSECNSKCKGDPSRTCGGAWRNEVFTTGRRKFVYLGCAIEGKWDRSLNIHAATSKRMNPSLCNQLCKRRGKRFFGLENRDDCYCGNSYGSRGLAEDSSKCNLRCAESDLYACGGKGYASAYRVR